MSKREAKRIYDERIIFVRAYENMMPDERIVLMSEADYEANKKLCADCLKVWRKRN